MINIADAMCSVAATSCELLGVRGSESRRRRLQRLVAVPGYALNRANDLLLLRADTDGESDSDSLEKTTNKHVVFFHGDIQVRG